MNFREQRAKLVEDMHALNAKATTENRSLTADEQTSFDRMNVDQANLKAQYERNEATEALVRELGQTRGAIVDPLQARSAAVSGDKQDSPEYKRALDHYVRTGDQSMFRDLNVTTAGDGGYTIPTDASSQIVLALNRGSVMRKAGASVLQTSKNTVIPVSSVVSGTWEPEADPFGNNADTDPTLTAFAANAYKFTVGTKISQELLDDSAVDMQALVNKLFSDSFVQNSDNAYVAGAGSGSNQPTGLLTGATTKVVASASTFTPAELLGHFYSVPSQYRADPSFAWIANDITIGLIASMATLSTNSSIVRIPFEYSKAVGQPDTLFGRPIYSSAAMTSTLDANAKVLVCGAMKYYQIVDRIKQAGIMRLNELFATTGQVGFVGSWRTDGKCVLPDAFRTLTLHS